MRKKRLSIAFTVLALGVGFLLIKNIGQQSFYLNRYSDNQLYLEIIPISGYRNLRFNTDRSGLYFLSKTGDCIGFHDLATGSEKIVYQTETGAQIEAFFFGGDTLYLKESDLNRSGSGTTSGSRIVRVVGDSVKKATVFSLPKPDFGSTNSRQEWEEMHRQQNQQDKSACEEALRDNEEIFDIDFGPFNRYLVTQDLSMAIERELCLDKEVPWESNPDAEASLIPMLETKSILATSELDSSDFEDIDGKLVDTARSITVTMQDNYCWNSCGNDVTINYKGKQVFIDRKLTTALPYFITSRTPSLGTIGGKMQAFDKSLVFEYNGKVYRLTDR